MACLVYIGQPLPYNVGDLVTYNGSCFELVRAVDNGWIDPSQSYFWTSVSCSVCGSSTGIQSSMSPLSSLAFASSSSDIGSQIISGDIQFLATVLMFTCGIILGKLVFDQIRA